MELLSRHKAVFFGNLELYKDRLVYNKFFGISSTTFPLKQISNISASRFSWWVIIETSGGQKHTIRFWSSSQTKAVEKAILDLMI